MTDSPTKDSHLTYLTLLREGQPTAPFLYGLAEKHAKTMRCNCDLDNWQPEPSTGHSHVCRIHEATMNEVLR